LWGTSASFQPKPARTSSGRSTSLEQANALVVRVEHGTTQLKALLEAQKANGEEIEKPLKQFQ